ncbi:hypothetical protein PSYAE_25725 [Pseudomonas amygdali pv. aesculi str. 0893_23]|nr:hypothetical protein PSYAE_25725 [Pseudomonas amygdali pv. aesculi str. 0893_23]
MVMIEMFCQSEKHLTRTLTKVGGSLLRNSIFT